MVFEPSVVSRGANAASGVTEGKAAELSREEIQEERKRLLSISGTRETGGIAAKLKLLNLKLRVYPAPINK